MLIVQVIGSDPIKPIERELDVYIEADETVADVKATLEHVTGIRSDDQKLFHQQTENGNNEHDHERHGGREGGNNAKELDCDEKRLVDYNILADVSPKSGGISEMLFLVTPSSSFEAISAVMGENNAGAASPQGSNEDRPSECC